MGFSPCCVLEKPDNYHKYFSTKNPPISKTINSRHSQLKYLSMKGLMVGPNFQNNPATRKNRTERLTVDAMMKPRKDILTIPAEIVHTL